jgi:catechol 2,3-dioxygenase-like lactoylglutathione lyase family enzyme
MPAVRYIVSDIDKSVAFYRDMLSFAVDMHVPGAGSAGLAGGNPEPGGWNRFQIVTDDLDAMIADLRGRRASFRGDIAGGPGGRQILLIDPSDNVVELFEHAKR